LVRATFSRADDEGFTRARGAKSNRSKKVARFPSLNSSDPFRNRPLLFCGESLSELKSSLHSLIAHSSMKPRSLLLLVLAALLTVAVPRPARALEVSFDFFYDSLSPHGEWLEVADYGYCWRPSNVEADWSPYSDGYWSYTDAGWTWVSYENFGGIVYHYGRWVNVDDEGWCWVPDYEWGPAWVSWRRSDEHVGWAPLPPQAEYRRERGISVWVDTEYDIGPSNYSFCRVRDFGAPVLRSVLVRRSENVVIINKTVNITNITYNEDRAVIFNGGPDYVEVNRYVERPIPALKLVQNNNITVINNRITNNNVQITNVNSVQQGNQLVVISPTVVRPQQERLAALVRPNVRRVVPREKVNRGWAGIAPEQRAVLKASIQKQTQGLTPQSAPARPVRVADLQVVPEKADPTAPVSTKAARPGRRGQANAAGVPAVSGDPAAPADSVPPAPAAAGAATPAPAGSPRRTAAERAARLKDPTPNPTPAAASAAETAPADPRTAPGSNATVPEAGTPAARREAARLAREKAVQERKERAGAATPAEKADATPSTPPAATPGERPRRGRPGAAPEIPGTPADPAAAPAENPAGAAQATDAAARRKANLEEAAARRAQAGEAAKEQATQRQEAVRQRAAERLQQQQEAAAQRKATEVAPERPTNAPEPAAERPAPVRPRGADPSAARQKATEAAQERQRTQQLRQQEAPVQREQPVARPPAAEPQVRQRNLEQQAVIQQRQAQQAAMRERAVQAAADRQPQREAAPAARVQRQAPEPDNGAAQAQLAARQAAMQRSQNQAAARQQQQQARPVAQPRPAAPAPARGAAARKGGKPLTPEEAAALQQ
jgi:hypothetical protein